ncbi:TNF receptor-associated factor 5-like [Dysidea avara]|uniref:TNF receptor-associated factor 5-like n=1 Tax=Dysidea avara TaxID=196820 RepID=UPI0033286932
MAIVLCTGGFEYQFVSSPPDRVVCKICHLPSRDPYLTMCCGHVFCKSCLDGMKEAKSIVNNICPVCRGEDFVTFPNKQIDREVKSLHVYCTNGGKGCEWQGEVNYIDNHLMKDGGCEYEDLLCISGCGGIIQRRDLTKHVETECPCRKVDCPYCQLRGEHQFIEGKHKEECDEYPLACPNKCEEAICIPRKDMSKHRSGCPLEVINCEYHTMGCEVRMTRQAQKEHNREKMEYHLQLTKYKLDETRGELSKTKHETKLELDATNVKLNEALKELTRTKGELSDVKSQFANRITTLELLLHQSNVSASNFASDASASNLVPAKPAPMIWSRQLHSATQASLRGNQIIPVTFKMTGVAKKLKTQRDWYSNPFYTDITGYRIRLCVDVGGHGNHEGTHCSMFLRLMRGRHDNDLSWPLKIELQVTLLNQINDDQHYSQRFPFIDYVHDRNVTHRIFHNDMAEAGLGHSSFVSRQDLSKITATC